MILIITHKADFTADFIVNKLNKRKIPYKRFNCEDVLTHQLDFEFNDGFSCSILDESKYDAVWFRRTKLPEIENLSDEKKLYLLNETDNLLRNIFSVISAKWLSCPNSVHEAENKLLQLKVAKQIGFDIPKTLVTNSKNRLKQFYIQNNQNIIVKPISQTRMVHKKESAFIFTNQVPNKIMDSLGEFDLTPCIFQENVFKDYEIRVTVVEEKVFAAGVYSQEHEETKTDWRKKKTDFVEVTLPEGIRDLCIQILKELNLGFGAIDLIRTPEGRYIFLEINPNGQWVWIENETGHNISDAIIDYLIEV